MIAMVGSTIGVVLGISARESAVAFETETIEYPYREDLAAIEVVASRVKDIVRPELVPTMIDVSYRTADEIDSAYADSVNWGELCAEVRDADLRSDFEGMSR